MPAPDKQPSTDFVPWLAESTHGNSKGIAGLQQDPTVTGWIEPTLGTGYAAPAAPMAGVRYRMHTKTSSLEFGGHIDVSGATTGTVAFTLIQPFWPEYDISFITDIYDGAAFGVARVFINSVNGEVTLSWPAV